MICMKLLKVSCTLDNDGSSLLAMLNFEEFLSIHRIPHKNHLNLTFSLTLHNFFTSELLNLGEIITDFF